MPSTHNTDRTARANKAAGDSFDAAAQGAQRFTDQVTQIFGLTGERGEEFTRRSSQTLEAVTEAGTIMTRGFQDLSREWFTFLQESTQKNIEGLTTLARSRSMPELVSAQTELMRNSMQQTIDGTRKMAEMTTRVMTETSQTVMAQANGTRRAV